MPKLIACGAGLVALIAGVFGNVEPLLCMQRAVVALVIGGCLGALWQAMTSVPVQLRVIEKPTSGDRDTKEGENAKAA